VVEEQRPAAPPAVPRLGRGTALVPALRMVVGASGVHMVPAQPPAQCSHGPSDRELNQMALGGIRRGSVWTCDLCWLGGFVGMKRWNGRHYVPFEPGDGMQTEGWLQRMSRGSSPAEMEALGAAMARIPVARRRRLLAQ
jgi:hypothetical protein